MAACRARRAVTVEEVRVAEETVTFRSPPIPLARQGLLSRWRSTPTSPPPTLRAFLADYELGAPVALEGIAEGVENSNFRLADRARPLHPHHLREARRPGRPAVLPRPDGASRPPRPALPAAGACARRRGPAPARRQARRDRQLPRRAAGRAGSRSSTAPPWARRWRHCIWPPPTSRSPAPTRSRCAGWHALFDGCRGKADAVEPGLEAEIAAELADLARAWPAGPAGRA